ncbi:MAG TPA: malonyl-ACP O-methyltransferase BioC [Rhodanobacteraceae bacterium]
MNDFTLDTRQVRHAFARAAATYEAHAVVQREVQDELLARLVFYLDQPKRILDVGAGTGEGTAKLKKRYPKADVVALDMTLPMLRLARRHSRLLKPFARVAGTATRLPFADHSFDIVHSNLCFQWCTDLAALFAEMQRVLAPGGFLVFSTLGPDTLKELRAAFAHDGDTPHVAPFIDMHDIGDEMIAAGLRDPVLDVSRITLTYETPEGVLRDLKGLGATSADATRPRGLMGRARYRQMLAAYETLRVDGRIPATCEIVEGHAWGPPPGYLPRIPLGVQKVHFPPAP